MKFPAQFLKVLCPGIDPHIARWTVTPTVRVLLSYARIATSERVRSLSQIGLVGFDMRAAAINSHQAIFSNSASRRSLAIGRHDQQTSQEIRQFLGWHSERSEQLGQK